MEINHGGDLFAISRAHGWDWRTVLDFSASINPLGPPAGVEEAIKEALPRIVHYPERQAERLAQKLAEVWDLLPSEIILGGGVTELLHFVARNFHAPRTTIVVPAYMEFHRAFPFVSWVNFSEPETWPTDGLLVLTHPNVPTGQCWPFETLREWLVNARHPVLIDESFLDFTGMPSAASLRAWKKNLLVLRTLSKSYALPGLRIGALVGHEDTIGELRRRREPWQVSALAEAAALAALEDRTYLDRTRAFIAAEREWLMQELATVPGLYAVPSSVNFLLLYVESAGDFCKWCLARKVILRDCTGWPGVGHDAIRVAIRTRAENQRLVDLLREYYCGY